jgi:hypothetical protein
MAIGNLSICSRLVAGRIEIRDDLVPVPRAGRLSGRSRNGNLFELLSLYVCW